MKKVIAIITGGDSSEIVISLRSAEQVRQCLDKKKYDTYIVFIQKDDWHVKLDSREQIPVNRHDFSFIKGKKKIVFDYAFFAMHGPPGEDGKLQAYMELLSIPYSTSGVLSLALSFDKYACKCYLEHFDILTARSVLLNKRESFDADEIAEFIGLPCIIKPNRGGSSFGVSKINRTDDLSKAIMIAMKEDKQVIIEEFLPGVELTCGLIKVGGNDYIFPVTEIVSRNEFFDYEAKYTDGKAEEIIPARISPNLSAKCQMTASEIYDLLDCRGLVRVDFIAKNDDLYFLELNGIPGMTRESIIPRMIRAYGLSEARIYEMIIADSSS